MITRVRIEGAYVKSNVFVSNGVVVAADCGFNYLVGYSVDILWPELYRQGFLFDVVEEDHDEWMIYKNEEFKKWMRSTGRQTGQSDMERRMVESERIVKT